MKKLRTKIAVVKGVLALTMAVAFQGSPAVAQNWPDEPINLIVPWPAGGGQDRVARILAEFLDQQVPVSVVVSNVPGAAGANGVRAIEESTPDGYTIGTMGLHVIAQTYINPNATDLERIAPLVMVNSNSAAISVRADLGINTLAEFIEYAKANPGMIINGNDAPGGFSFLTVELMERQLGIELTKVPYQGYAPTVAALVAGEVNSASLPVPVVADLHAAGTIKILAIAAEERNFAAPDVPTFKELGYDFVFADSVMIFGPVGMDADVKGAVEKALLDAMASDGFKAAGSTAGLTLQPLGSADADALFRALDESVYPVLLEADLVKTRQK